MSFLSRIISRKLNKPEEITRLLQFNQRLSMLLQEDRYLARSDYRSLVEEYADINIFFQNQKKATTLDVYCEKYSIKMDTVEGFLRSYTDLYNHKERPIKSARATNVETYKLLPKENEA